MKSMGELAGLCGALVKQVGRCPGGRGREVGAVCGEPEVCAWWEFTGVKVAQWG